jgi:hypothetical protein
MNKYLFYLASFGWSVGLIVFLFSFFKIDVRSGIPFIWVFHIGIFVIWFPLTFKLKEYEESKKQNIGSKQKHKGFTFFDHTPTWMTIIVILSWVNALGNFIWHMTTYIGVPDIENGQFILADHGNFIKTLTENQYHYYRAGELGFFSAGWLVAYGTAAAYLYDLIESE